MPDDAVMQTIIKSIQDFQPELAAIRRDIHTHPELGLQEVRTASVVALTLRGWGLEVTEHVGKTGVVGTIRGARAGHRAIGLRADMDALPILEQTLLPYASLSSGIMHACGHDGHTAMLLGAGRYLAQNPDFRGTVHLIFQPAEEGRGGAQAMIADGLFERFPCDAIYGMHASPGLPVGHFATRPGAMMAAADKWTVTFRGTGGHGGSTPYLATDVTVALGYFLLGVQTIVSRNIAPNEQAVVSIGYISGGAVSAPAVMPAEMAVSGIARSYTDEVRDTIEDRLRELATSFAAAQRCVADVSYFRGGSPLTNHDRQVEQAISVARALVGADNVDGNMPPVTGSEDFAHMLRERPGAFIRIGNAGQRDNTRAALHSSHYDFNDDIIPLGAAYWVGLVRAELS